MSEKKYTDQQLLFLGYLGAEAKGDIDEAMKMAGYAPSSKGSVVKNLKMEIDGGTIVVSIIFAALLAVPFVLDYRRRKQKGE